MGAENFIVIARENGRYVEYKQEVLPLVGEVSAPKIFPESVEESGQILVRSLEGPAATVIAYDGGEWRIFSKPLLSEIAEIPTRAQQLRDQEVVIRRAARGYAKEKLVHLSLMVAGLTTVAAGAFEFIKSLS